MPERLAAFRRLLSQPDFTEQFVPGIIAEALAGLLSIPRDAPEHRLRSALEVAKHAIGMQSEMQAFVRVAEAELAEGKKAAKSSTL